ncbi:MAG: Gfo/Idh/MocA family oxidoreductase [Clostridia bacterium]|nr:Gfo/Idh/MocA family oxidoreductase [Clostridia bacterium]
MNKKMRIGIFGVRRGAGFVKLFAERDDTLVTAVCDSNPRELEKIQEHITKYNIQVFTDFDTFIDSGLFDAVMLVNYFYEHAPYAIRAMEKGIHVLSECTPACTLAECVALCRAVERTGCKYMLAENYPFMAHCVDMKRRYETGAFGRAVFCEGEYNHPVTPHDKNLLAPGRLHWRNWLPRTYYITHALAPILHITGNELKAVNCKSVFAPDNLRGTAAMVGDLASIILCEMKDGSLARVTGCSAWGGHGTRYRICGEKGNMQNFTHDPGKVYIQYDPWHTPEGQESNQVVEAKWFDDEAKNEALREVGHGGGDWWVTEVFARYVLDDEKPFFDVYRSVSLSAAAIFAQRSSNNGGAEYLIPDFRNEEERKVWENDDLSPFPDENGHAGMPCCSHPDFRPTEEDYAQAEADWKESGLI